MRSELAGFSSPPYEGGEAAASADGVVHSYPRRAEIEQKAFPAPRSTPPAPRFSIPDTHFQPPDTRIFEARYTKFGGVGTHVVNVGCVGTPGA